MQAAGGSGSGRLEESPVSASTIIDAGLASDVEGMDVLHARHLTESDVEDESVGSEGQLEDEDTQDVQGPPSDGQLEHALLTHQYADNTPPKKKMRKRKTSAVWNIVKRLRDEKLLGPVIRKTLTAGEMCIHAFVQSILLCLLITVRPTD